MSTLTQSPVRPKTDLRDMLRQYLVKRSLACMEAAGKRRRAALNSGDIDVYCRTIRTAVQGFYGKLPVGRNGAPLNVIRVSSFEKEGYRIENVLFDSFPRWQVNATVYVPIDFKPPFPAVIVPVGHSGKQFEAYQLPCQFFARAGYLTVTFDPPGQAGEKQLGNDHFVDGVRCYLAGETSSRYFVGDALRCIDYLGTRNDADLSHGVAMTGVSGGGTTTTLAGLLDERITVLGPSCCVTPLADLDISQCYGGCPETHMWRRYAEGIDEVDLLCGAAPKPTLLMAGEKDEVFRIDDTRRLADEVRSFYQKASVEERFDFYADKRGHCYSLDQARQFTRFMNRWLRDEPDRPLPDLPDDTFLMDPYEEVRCYPCTEVNMRTLAVDQADKLCRSRDAAPEAVRQGAAEIAGVIDPVSLPNAEVGKPFRVWTHYWQQVILRPEEGIELPATFLYSVKDLPRATLLHFDDNGRHRLIYRMGALAKAVWFLNEQQTGFNLFTIDLRGWGDTTMAMYPYELPGWSGLDRFTAYMSAALGDHIMSMRIRDGLAALGYLRARAEGKGQRIVVSGSGLGGIVALHVAAIDGNTDGVAVWETLLSFLSLIAAEHYQWSADTFMPNVLKYYDLPELAAAVPCPVCFFNPLDGAGEKLSDCTLKTLRNDYGSNTTLTNIQWPAGIEELQRLLQGK